MLHQAIDQRVARCADRHGQAAGHAALPGAAVGAGGEGLDGLIDVGVGHDDQVVLRAAGRLDPFAVGRAGLVDVLGDAGGADERDGGDLGVGEQRIDALATAVDDVEHPRRQARFQQQLAQQHGRERDFF